MTEKCKICQVESTPWEYRKELNGHICQNCAFIRAYLATSCFDLFINDIMCSFNDNMREGDEEYLRESYLPRPIVVKHMIYSLTREWYKNQVINKVSLEGLDG